MLNMTRASASLEPGGVVQIKLEVDLSLMLGGPSEYTALLREPADEREAGIQAVTADILRDVQFTCDGVALPLELVSWELPKVAPESVGDVTIAAMTALSLRGILPPDAKSFAVVTATRTKLEFPLAFTLLVPSQKLSTTRWVELPGMESRHFAVPPNLLTAAAVQSEKSAPVASGAQEPSPNASTVAEDAPGVKTTAATAAPTTAATATTSDVSPFALALAKRIETAGQFLWLGFLHILPRGTDHILFVIGLFFLGLHWRPLISQTTAFTIAHTTTLGLSAYGIVSLSPRIVEPLIALSIVFVAVEDIFRPKLTAARIGIVFSFGLLHGLGFASSLSEVRLPRDEFFTALLAFNFGVDFGQLAVIALAFLLVGWWRNRPWYRQRIVIPACSLIALTGTWWAIIRIIG